ncbi:MAG: hypothetical protein H8E31_08375 [Planctomycetes bacterium]|nr:hypothetical protein [Planctomycetota bacterium]
MSKVYPEAWAKNDAGIYDLEPEPRPRNAYSKEPVEVPWVAMDLSNKPPWRIDIDRLAFVDAVMRLGGWDRLLDRLNTFLAMSRGRQGWLRRADNEISELHYMPLRDAMRRRIEAMAGVVPYWSTDTGPHLRVSCFLRYRQRWANTGICAARLSQMVLAAGQGLVWETDAQVREFNVRCEQARHRHGADIWSVRVEECWAREWPAWSASVYQGEDAQLSSAGELDPAGLEDPAE